MPAHRPASVLARKINIPRTQKVFLPDPEDFSPGPKRFLCPREKYALPEKRIRSPGEKSPLRRREES